MKLNSLIVFISAAALSACGGGSSSSPSENPRSDNLQVTAIDGYLRYAQVWLDLNGNWQLDANEPSAISGANGKALLDVSAIEDPSAYPLVVANIAGQTVDEDTISSQNPNGVPSARSYL